MKTILMLAGAAMALAATPAMAQDDTDRAGDIQFKLLGTAVLPDGKITDIRVNLPGLPATTQTRANDNVTPTIAIEYFISNNISIETIAGMTQPSGRRGAGIECQADPGDGDRQISLRSGRGETLCRGRAILLPVGER